VGAGLLVGVERAREGRLGPLAAHHVVLLRCDLLTPLLLALLALLQVFSSLRWCLTRLSRSINSPASVPSVTRCPPRFRQSQRGAPSGRRRTPAARSARREAGRCTPRRTRSPWRRRGSSRASG